MPTIETSQTKDRGYMGDRKRGASLGRASRDAATLLRRAREEVADLYRSLMAAQSGDNAHFYDGTPGTPFADQAAYIARYESLLEPARRHLAELEAAQGKTRFHLRQIRLDSSGYDQGGSYWGHGGQLFEAFNGAGDYMTCRIERGDEHRTDYIREAYQQQQARNLFTCISPAKADREAAKRHVRDDHPEATFYR